MKPSYRVVVADIRSPRDGAFIEIIGHFNPRTNPETLVINEERALDWLKNGAQPTATAGRLLTKNQLSTHRMRYKLPKRPRNRVR